MVDSHIFYVRSRSRLVQTALVEPHFVEGQSQRDSYFVFTNEAGRGCAAVGIAECEVDNRFVAFHGDTGTYCYLSFPPGIVSVAGFYAVIGTTYAYTCPVTYTLEKVVGVDLREKLGSDGSLECIVEIVG